MFKLDMPVRTGCASNIYFSRLCTTMPHRNILCKGGHCAAV